MWVAPSDGSPDRGHERSSLYLPSLSSSSILLLQHSLLILEPSSLDFQRKQKARAVQNPLGPLHHDGTTKTSHHGLQHARILNLSRVRWMLSDYLDHMPCQSDKSFYKLCSFREPWLIHFSTHSLKTFSQWVPLRGLIWHLSPHHEHQKAVASFKLLCPMQTHALLLSQQSRTN